MVEEKDRNIFKKYVRSNEERVNSVISQIANGIKTLAVCVGDGFGSLNGKEFTNLATFRFSLGEGEVLERVAVTSLPSFPKIQGELVRADIHENDISTASLPFRDLLRLEIEPFIIGVGWVKVDYTPEGVVVFRSNIREVLSRHDALINYDRVLQYNRQNQSQ